MSVTRAAQVAAVAAWKAHAALAALITAATPGATPRIYDGEAPRQADGSLPPLPYIVVDSPTAVPLNALDSPGSDATITVSAWATTKGKAQHLAGLMTEALREPVQLEGHHPARLKWEFETAIRAGDGNYQVPVRYRVRTMEA